MKKILISAITLLLFGGFTLAVKAQTTESEKGYISVNKSTTIEISPNQAEITISVETSDASVKKATAENKIIANKVYSTLKSIIGREDYIKTGNYTINPQYSYTKENKRILDKYSVSNTVTVKTKNIDIIPKLIDTSIAQGANKINNLQFSASDYDEACQNATSELAKKAYLQGNSIAKAINSQIIGIKSINAICNPESSSRPFYAMMTKGAEDSISSTSIEAGKLKIYANVDASFYLK